jgi:hypothetical protein
VLTCGDRFLIPVAVEESVVAEPKVNKPPAGPKVSPVRTIVSLVLLLVVGAVCVIELRAGLGQMLTGKAFAAKSEEGAFTGVKLSEAKGMVSMFPEETVHRETDSDIVYKYQWFSLLRPLLGETSPQMYLYADKDPEPNALGFYTEAEDDPPVRTAPAATSGAGGGPPAGMGMGMMPGMGGGGPGGGGPGGGGPGGGAGGRGPGGGGPGRGEGGRGRPAVEDDTATSDPAATDTAAPTDTPATDASDPAPAEPAATEPAKTEEDVPTSDAPATTEQDPAPPQYRMANDGFVKRRAILQGRQIRDLSAPSR